MVDSKADQQEVNILKQKLDHLEKECDEVRQRGMKGNLIISSPGIQGKSSLMVSNTITIQGEQRKESDQEMIQRLIKVKTGVVVPVRVMTACHAINKRGSDSSSVVSISDRAPGSAWEVLAAGLLTGKNSNTRENFTDANVYINFQITKNKSELVKAAKVAKKDRKIKKYGVDQNGRLTVKVSASSKFEEVSSLAGLEHLVATVPSAPPAPAGAWSGGRRH